MNRSLKDDVSTGCMMPHEKYTHISSSLVKEVSCLGGDVSKYVPVNVNTILKKYINEKI